MRWVVAAVAVVLAGCASVAVVGAPPVSVPRAVEVRVAVLATDQTPITDADVRIDGRSATSVKLLPYELPVVVEVQRPGYHPVSMQVSKAGTITLMLEPVTLVGRITTPDGAGLPDAVIHLGDAEATSDGEGRFVIAPAEPGMLTVDRPGRLPVARPWTEGRVDVALEPRIVKALHAVMSLPGQSTWEAFLGLADRTEINAVVLDVKDESGRISHRSAVPLAAELGAVYGSYGLAPVVADLHDRGLYVIGRVVTFADPVVANARPDLAIRRGARPYRKGSQAFLDPTDTEARRYALDLAVEACEAGMDEIQFDYVRFPAGMTTAMSLDGDGVYVGSEGQPYRLEAISGFLAEARRVLHERGCAVAADVFAIVLSTGNDQGIGQRPEELSAVVDVLSPMIYPDHYADGWIGFDQPRDHPGTVVANALADGMGRLAPTVIMRPWLADFNYGASSVRAEIDAAESFSVGWMLWNPGSRHTERALLIASE